MSIALDIPLYAGLVSLYLPSSSSTEAQGKSRDFYMNERSEVLPWINLVRCVGWKPPGPLKP